MPPWSIRDQTEAWRELVISRFLQSHRGDFALTHVDLAIDIDLDLAHELSDSSVTHGAYGIPWNIFGN